MNQSASAPTLLVCTVGGSPAPIVAAHRALQPQFTVFVCSGPDPATGQPGSERQIDGAGNDSLAAQLGLVATDYAILCVPADALETIVMAVQGEFARLRAAHPAARLVADYTGGTKTMSAALVVAALQSDGVELHLVTGARADLVKIRRNASAIRVDTAELRGRRQIDDALGAWQSHDYDAAAARLEVLPAPAGLAAERNRALDLSRAFAAWDRFDHARAADILADYRQWVGRQHGELLTQIEHLADRKQGKRAAAEREPRLILDLWRNAERRAAQGRFDDAVARLYRLLEWTAQWALREHCGIDTGDLRAEQLPAGIAIVPNRSGRRQCGLWLAWNLLAHHAPASKLAGIFIADGARLSDHLLARNDSILAHGRTPVPIERWLAMHDWIGGGVLPALLAEASLKQLPPQLPQHLPQRGSAAALPCEA